MLAVAIIPAMARASSVDSTASSAPLRVNAALGCGSSYSCTSVNALTFSFAISGSTQGTLHFTNLSGVNWHNLILTETGIAASDITCSSNLFNCSVMPDGANGARIVLTVFGAMIGVPAGQSFELGFGCKSGGCVAWPSTEFSAEANLVPEPNTGVLALTGVGLIGAAVIVWRKHVFSA